MFKVINKICHGGGIYTWKSANSTNQGLIPCFADNLASEKLWRKSQQCRLSLIVMSTVICGGHISKYPADP